MEYKFEIHEKLLISYSNFFKNALTHEWKEAAERTIKLPAIGAGTFHVFANWVYTGHICSIRADDETSEREDRSKFVTILYSCYIGGDFLLAADFKDAIISAMIGLMTEHDFVPGGLARTIYSSSLTTSVHRRMCVDIFLNTKSRKSFNDIRNRNLPTDFLVDALADVGNHLNEGLKKQSTREFLRRKSSCDYHDHVSLGTPCYKVKFGY
ncbi:hypothetical protein NX059_012296 [Plenodomus lindquistii]|nr:hypothetical protein NX059_012296 [Plenodomus lindquistii]